MMVSERLECAKKKEGFLPAKKKPKLHFFCDPSQSGPGVEFKGQLPSFGPPTKKMLISTKDKQ